MARRRGVSTRVHRTLHDETYKALHTSGHSAHVTEHRPPIIYSCVDVVGSPIVDTGIKSCVDGVGSVGRKNYSVKHFTPEMTCSRFSDLVPIP